MEIKLYNGNIMVKELKRTDEETKSDHGLYIPEQSLEDEQVSQGTVVRSDSEGVSIGDTLMFHKVMPVDINMKMEGDIKLESYFFIKEQDIICKITKQ